MDYFLDVWRKYAHFSGRARRKEYWLFALFNALVMILFEVLVFITEALFGANSIAALVVALPLLVYIVAGIVPGLAVAVRRLHDVNQSGWLFLLGFIPLIGGLALLVLSVLPGTEGDNKYGSDPKQELIPAAV